jgi:hypothetical protein
MEFTLIIMTFDRNTFTRVYLCTRRVRGSRSSEAVWDTRSLCAYSTARGILLKWRYSPCRDSVRVAKSIYIYFRTCKRGIYQRYDAYKNRSDDYLFFLWDQFSGILKLIMCTSVLPRMGSVIFCQFNELARWLQMLLCY